MIDETNENNIEKSFDATIKSSELVGVFLDVADVSIDSFLGEGVIKELPIVKLVYALIKDGVNIHDKLFLKKIVSFLKCIKDIDPAKRQEMIDAIDASKKYRIRVGEKLLYVLDTCNDNEASELVGELFKGFLEGLISYHDYLASANAVASLPVGEIEEFVKEYSDEWKDINDVYSKIYTGLYEISYDAPNVSVAENDDYKELLEGGNKYKAEVDGGIMWIKPNVVGKTIYLVLKDYFS